MVAADDSINYIEWSQLGALKKLKAKSTIYTGTVVMGQMFAAQEQIPEGKASVGVALKEGQYPAGVKPGDIVAAYRVGSSSSSSSGDSADKDTSSSASGGAIVPDARVNGVADDGDSTVSTGNKSFTLLVDEADAAALASAAAAGEVAIVRVPGN